MSLKLNIEESISQLKNFSLEDKRNFVESVDVSVMLGIDPKQSSQTVKGFVVAPSGLGKKLKVVVLTSVEEQKKAALDAGAIFAGSDDLIAKIGQGFVDFDNCIATPEIMQSLGKIAKKLGPKGLMPSKKDGTVSNNVKEVVESCLKGRMSFRNDKSGIIHCSIGKINFTSENLILNFKALIKMIKSLKPESSKGQYIKKIYLNTTMGKALEVSLDNLI